MYILSAMKERGKWTENCPAFPFIKKEEKEEGRKETKLPVSRTSFYSVHKYHFIYIYKGVGEMHLYQNTSIRLSFNFS